MVTEIIIPVMDQATETVQLMAWRKQEGDVVEKGEVVCDIETEKAVVEIEAGAAGVLRKLLVEAGARIPPKTVIGLIAAAGEALPDLAQYKPAPAASPMASAAPMAQQAAAPAAAVAPTGPAAGDRRVVASPRAKRLAEENKLDLSTITGAGPDGRILEEDVLKAVKQAADPSARLARAKAERVTQSWRTIPHFYTSITADMSRVAKRKAVAPGATYTDCLALAVAQALAKHPSLNGHWTNDALAVIAEVRLGLVVQAERGLMIAVLRDLRGRSLESIAAERGPLVQQALSGKFETAPLEATFTLSNIGAGHIDSFTALISPPQVAILSVGAIQPRPVVVGGEIVARPTATLTLGADHRAIDGRKAAAFLEDLKTILEAAE